MHSGANYAEGDAIHGGLHSRSSARRRNPMACLICRRRKIKCEFNNGQDVCDHCRSKNTKCTVLSVAQEEALKTLRYTDESLAYMSNYDLESLLRSLALPSQLHSSAEHTEAARLHQHYGPPSSPHHPLPSTGHDNLYRSHDPANRAVPPSPYTHNYHTAGHTGSTNPANVPTNTPHSQAHSAHNHHTANRTGPTIPANVPTNTPHLQAHSTHNHHIASRTGSTNPATVPTNTPRPQAHPHHQSSIYPAYTSPSPNHQMSYQIPATGGPSVPHHTMPVGDHHQLQPQLHPNIPAHSNAVQSQDHANYSGQANYPFQPNQQPSQGQIAQYQHGGYPATMAPGFNT
ncbi:hypothetical protein JOM56_008671 [Amanita muscaria]